jgi:hypothetical protein
MATVSVIATSADGTRAALRAAAEVASRGIMRLWLFVRAGEDGVLPDARELGDATVVTYSGRYEDLTTIIPRSAPVVLGGRGGLWRATPEQQLARKFAALGYRVIFALSNTSRSARPATATSASWASFKGET